MKKPLFLALTMVLIMAGTIIIANGSVFAASPTPTLTPTPTPTPTATPTPAPTPTPTLWYVTDNVNKRLGLGVIPQYELDVSDMNEMESVIHFSLNGNNVGGWITSVVNNNLFFSSGAFYDSNLGGFIQATTDGGAIVAGSEQTGYEIWTASGTSVGSVAPLTRSFLILPGGNVGIGIADPVPGPQQALEVNGGLRMNTAIEQPVCSATVRGTLWVVQGASSDALQVCLFSGGSYVWRTFEYVTY